MKIRNIDHHDNWATPPMVLGRLMEEYKFDFDPCPLNHDVTLWDGLTCDWGKRNFINPPYSRTLKEAFVNRAIEESKKGKLCVLLLPVSTSTKLFHDVILKNNGQVKFIKGRISFIGINDKGQKVNYHLIEAATKETIEYKGETIPLHIKNSGQHDSMIVIFDNKKQV